MTRRDTILFLIILLISVGMIAGSFFLMKKTEELRSVENSLRVQKKQTELQIDEKLRQIEVYKKAIARLERYQIELPENEVAFYSWVQQKLTDNGLRSDMVKPSSSKEGRNGVQVDFQGPYYSFVRTLSDWRNLKIALRLSSVRIEAMDDGGAKGIAIVESVIVK
ncbi:MAG: hypothetical protein GX181_04495 [Synergistaceae bacterium]|nr:hypothetical protein [Synergistota bacterium]NLM71210.1 hypothetical protein [Synergistaceae bacterium]